jgi:uncharacterized protein (DUF697 family)
MAAETKRSRKLPLSPLAIAGLLRELRASAAADKPLVVAGAKELAAVLRRELTRGGVAAAVREGPVDDAAAVVYVLADEVDEDDERTLRAAERAGVPVLCVVAGPAAARTETIPYVLAENVIPAGSGAGFPLERIARRLAATLGERATPLAARLPVLRRAVCEELIRRFARQNALIGAAVFVPGADLPALTLNQIRLVIRIADAYGFEVDRERLPELLAVIGSGLGLRTIARQALGLVPVAGWAIKGGIAYAGTRALGEAAIRYFEHRAPVTRVAGDRARFPR